MPGAENDGHADAVGRLERVEERGHAVEPREEQLVLLAAREHSLDGVALNILQRVGHPSCATRKGIVKMPREGDDATTLKVANNLLPHAAEGYAVEIAAVAQFEMPQVETHDGGIVAADAQDVAAVGIAHPFVAVDGVILMAEHILAFCSHLLQRTEQSLRALRTPAVGHRLSGLLAVAAGCTKHGGGSYNH